ncbi:MAG: heavy metal sensor signal transduction histidine kinase [Acidobacteriales bacterium]|nr:heavy metal sensor signal transduction histidine kinase [Terriglobales bacterium]
MMLLSFLLLWGLRQSIHSTADRELKGKMDAVTAMMQVSVPKLSLAELEDEFREQSSLGGDLIQVKSSDGGWVFRSPSTQQFAPELVKIASADQPGVHETETKGKRYRVLTQPLEIGGRKYLVQVAANISDFAELQRKFFWLTMLLIPLMIVGASTGGYWLSGRAFKPVTTIIEKARSINATNLSSRLAVSGNKDELHKLSETLNGMLDRIESSFKKVQQFSDDASHELRTPISLIRTTAELALRRERDPETYRTALNEILIESEKTSEMIESLLVLARSDASSQPQLPLLKTDIAAIVRDCCNKVAPFTQSRELSHVVDLPSTPTVILGDAKFLERLLLLILDNAIKYSHPGGQIRTKLERIAGSVTVTVEDTGIGISEEDLPRIFERFYRADKARSRDGAGAGLGLSIAKWIADMHHAELLVASSVGQGSSFTIRFPQISVE